MFSGRAATLKWQAMTLLHASAPSHLLQKRHPPPLGSKFLRLLLQKRLCPPFKGCFPLVSLQNRRPPTLTEPIRASRPPSPPSQSWFTHLACKAEAAHPCETRLSQRHGFPNRPRKAQFAFSVGTVIVPCLLCDLPPQAKGCTAPSGIMKR